MLNDPILTTRLTGNLNRGRTRGGVAIVALVACDGGVALGALLLPPQAPAVVIKLAETYEVAPVARSYDSARNRAATFTVESDIGVFGAAATGVVTRRVRRQTLVMFQAMKAIPSGTHVLVPSKWASPPLKDTVSPTRYSSSRSGTVTLVLDNVVPLGHTTGVLSPSIARTRQPSEIAISPVNFASAPSVLLLEISTVVPATVFSLKSVYEVEPGDAQADK